jgi:hypothetical protein
MNLRSRPQSPLARLQRYCFARAGEADRLDSNGVRRCSFEAKGAALGRLHAGRGQGLSGVHRYVRSGPVYLSPSRRFGVSGHSARQSAQEGEARREGSTWHLPVRHLQGVAPDEQERRHASMGPAQTGQCLRALGRNARGMPALPLGGRSDSALAPLPDAGESTRRSPQSGRSACDQAARVRASSGRLHAFNPRAASAPPACRPGRGPRRH